MRLTRLHAENFRNLSDISVSFDPALNLFSGQNGSGKTSLLETVYFLGSGRSFRSAKVDPVTKRGEDFCLVTGEVETASHGLTSIGFHRTKDGQRTMRINGANQHQASELARYLPTLILGPQSVELLTGPPPDRRSFLNRAVFHVEHSFSEVWSQGVRSLRQRNVLLREEAPSSELEPWTRQFISLSEQIDEMRSAFMEAFLPVFSDTYRFLLDLESVKCSYRRGWDQSKSLEEVLQDQLNTDRQRRFTHSGFQRADLRFTIEGKPVSEICSRGELKLIAWAAILAQGTLLARTEDSRPVFMVDDLVAELDKQHQIAVADLLSKIGGQVLVTGTDADRLKALWDKTSMKMFHVEQGSIRELEKQE